MKELSPLTCLRCSETWTPKVENPRCCPRCKSPLWNTPYRRGPKKPPKSVTHIKDEPKLPEFHHPHNQAASQQAIGQDDVPLSYAEQVKLAVERMRK